MKPGNIILDLLRTYGQRGTNVQDIASTGHLFGFSDNQIRVTLSRLVSRGIVEKRQRGHYRLCQITDPVNDFAERWREGEARVKPWPNATWLCVHIAGSDLSQTRAQTKAEWALTNHGFIAVDARFWIRPDNLSTPANALKQQLLTLGLPASAIMIENARLDSSLTQMWLKSFDAAAIKARYREMNEQLEASLRRLAELPVTQAKKESFELGGRAIQIMAKDPLLPETLLSPATRQQLWQTMCRYDEAGRHIWAGQQQPDTTPTSQMQFEISEIAL
ncbi:MAG: phenylacetic acid degradation operon negative regulatory protein [Candidatus Azotimanducaceae bacterium]|jgi:phenylacetic acid degradation operon negative regulatory protein